MSLRTLASVLLNEATGIILQQQNPKAGPDLTIDRKVKLEGFVTLQNKLKQAGRSHKGIYKELVIMRHGFSNAQLVGEQNPYVEGQVDAKWNQWKKFVKEGRFFKDEKKIHDPFLAPKGEQEAMRVTYRDIPELIVVSPMRRTLQTLRLSLVNLVNKCRALGNQCKLPEIYIHPGVTEMSRGSESSPWMDLENTPKPFNTTMVAPQLHYLLNRNGGFQRAGGKVTIHPKILAEMNIRDRGPNHSWYSSLPGEMMERMQKDPFTPSVSRLEDFRLWLVKRKEHTVMIVAHGLFILELNRQGKVALGTFDPKAKEPRLSNAAPMSAILQQAGANLAITLI